jgi:hypothetical protein
MLKTFSFPAARIDGRISTTQVAGPHFGDGNMAEKQKPQEDIVKLAGRAMTHPEKITGSEIKRMAARLLDDQRNDKGANKSKPSIAAQVIAKVGDLLPGSSPSDTKPKAKPTAAPANAAPASKGPAKSAPAPKAAATPKSAAAPKAAAKDQPAAAPAPTAAPSKAAPKPAPAAAKTAAPSKAAAPAPKPAPAKAKAPAKK